MIPTTNEFIISSNLLVAIFSISPADLVDNYFRIASADFLLVYQVIFGCIGKMKLFIFCEEEKKKVPEKI